MLSVFMAIASLSVVSNRAALFCSSPLFTQCPYMVNAHVSIIFRMYLFSYGFGCSSLSVIVFGVRRNFCSRRQTHTQSMIACEVEPHWEFSVTVVFLVDASGIYNLVHAHVPWTFFSAKTQRTPWEREWVEKGCREDSKVTTKMVKTSKFWWNVNNIQIWYW